MRTQKLTLVRIAPISLLIAGLLMTACQTSTAQALTTTGSGQTGAVQVAQAAAAAPTALPTRAVATSTSVAADGTLTLATPLVSATFDTTW